MLARLKSSYALAYVVFPLIILLFAPAEAFARPQGDWLFGLVVILPFSFVSGLLSCCFHYGRHDLTSIDPFYVRAWWTMLGGAVALPVCAWFRPSVAGVAFLVFTFGAGAVVGFHVYRRYAKRPPA